MVVVIVVFIILTVVVVVISIVTVFDGIIVAFTLCSYLRYYSCSCSCTLHQQKPVAML